MAHDRQLLLPAPAGLDLEPPHKPPAAGQGDKDIHVIISPAPNPAHQGRPSHTGERRPCYLLRCDS